MVSNKFWAFMIFTLIVFNVNAQLANWTNSGFTNFPINKGGQINGMSRTNELVFHATNPLKMYATSVEGGLYLTTNGGDSWHPAEGTEHMTAKSASVCVDRRNDQIILLGTGDPNYYYSWSGVGDGVYRSTDGGQSFTPTSLRGKLVLKIIQHPTIPDVYIASTESGMYRSADNGLTWTLTSSVTKFNDLIKNPFSTSLTLYATTLEASTDFYRSFDFGLSWQKIMSVSNGGGGRVGVTIADTSVVYFESISGGGVIHKSTNGGTTFSVVKGIGRPHLTSYDESYDGGQGNYDNTIWVDSRDANKIWLQSHNTWYSIDGGINWTQLTHWTTKVHTDMHHIVQSPFDPDKLYSCNDGGIFLSTDGGNNWVPKCDGFYAYEIGDGAAAASKTSPNYMMIGTQDNGKLYRDSVSWYTTLGGDDYGYKASDYLPFGGYVYYYDLGKSYRYSVDKKRDYYSGISSIAGNGSEPKQFAFSKLNTELGLAIVKTSSVVQKYYKTLDLSTVDPSNVTTPTWTELAGINNTDPIRFIHCSAVNKEKVFFVVKDKLYVTNNISAALPTFTTFDLPTIAYTNQGIASNAKNEDLIYLLNDRKIFESRNGGQSWTDITFNLPNVDHRAVLAEEYGGTEELVFVATNNAVYYKKFGQNRWTIYTTNLPKRKPPTGFSIFDDGTNRSLLRYFSFGKAVYETTFDNLRVLDAQIDFVGSNKQTCASSKVKFADFSLGKINNPIVKTWSFPGGTPSTSTEDSPEVTYPKSGYYNVSFSVNDGVNKSSTKIFKKYVEVEKCVADTIPGNALIVGNTTDNYGQTGIVGLGTTNTLTLMAWIKIDVDQPDWSGILFSGAGVSGLKFSDGNHLSYEWDGYYGFSGPIVPKGKWNHVALVMTPNNATLYLNGVPTVNDRGHGVINFNQGFNIGSDRGNSSRNMIGKVDEVAIYSRALTTDEIRSTMYLTKHNNSDPSLKAYFQFNEDTKTIKDWSGNNVSLTILNAGLRNSIRSTAPVGNGVTQKLTINSSGVKTFNQVGAELNFGSGSYPDGDVYITVLNQQPTKVPRLVNRSNLSKRYWIINNFGNNSDITAPVAFKFKGYGALTSSQVNNPSNFNLQYVTNGLTDDSTQWTSPNITASNAIENDQVIEYPSFILPSMASMDQTIALSVNQDIIYYRDADEDGFGDPNNSIYSSSVTASVGYVQNNFDCDDSNAAVNPNAEEIFGNNIDENCDGIIQHTITATTGSISPAGTMFVNNGGSLTYTITPINCYEITDVLVDGISVGNVTTYTFNNITQNHSITAVYTRTLPAAATSISGATVVCANSQVTYTIPLISRASSYTWTLPDGTTSTTNTNKLVYNVPGIAGQGEISVYGVNDCGIGSSSSITIQINTLPIGFDLLTPTNILLGNNVNSPIKSTAIALDGSNDYIGTNLNLSNLSKFTIEGRVNLNENNADLFGQDNVIEFKTTSTEFNVWTPNGGTLNYNYGNRFLSNTWHHIALVGDGSSLKLYLDGTLLTTDGGSTNNYGIDNNTNFTIGALIAGGHLNGKVDEVRVWNTARSAQQINENKDIELVGSQNGLLAYYKFNEGIAFESNIGLTTVTDYTNNGYHGILKNSALSGINSNWVADLSTLGNPWLSSDLSIFTVSSQGQITAISTGTATLTYSYGACNYDKTINIVNTIVGGTVSGSTTVCAGVNSSSLELNGSFGNIQWQSSNNGVNWNDIAGANLTTYTAINLTTTTSYRAVVSSATSSVTSSVASITVNQLPISLITTSGATTICQGSNLTLTASEGASYLWNNGATTKSITVATAGNFSVTITNAFGCQSTSANTTITLSSLPVGFDFTIPSSILVGESFDAKINATSIAFDGTNDYISTNLNLSNSSRFTIEGRVKLNSNNAADLFGQDNVVEFNATTTQIKIWTPSGGSFNWNYGNQFPINTWHHLALVGDGTNMKLYLNGTQVASGGGSTSNYGVDANTRFSIGALISGGHLNGSVDEVRVWNTARTAQQINDNKDIELVGTQTGLLAYYKLNHGTAFEANTGITTVTDYSSNGNNGNLNNSSLSGSSSNWVADVSTLNHPWSSSDNSIFTVTNLGNISTENPGTATLTYSYETCTYGKTVNVVNTILGGSITGSTVVCAGDNSTNLVLNGSFGNIQWQSTTNGTDWNDIVGANLTSYTASNLMNTTTYRAVVSSSISSVTSNVASITVNQTPIAMITASGSTAICQGSNVTLTASDGTSYLWSNGATSKSIAASAAGNYTVTVTNSNGCNKTSTVVAVNVSSLPTNVLASTSSSTVNSGTQITLTGSGTGSSVDQEIFYSSFNETLSQMPTYWSGIASSESSSTSNTNGRLWFTYSYGGTTGTVLSTSAKNTTSSIVDGENYIYTKGLNLIAGKLYNISFIYRIGDIAYPQKLKVTVGQATNPSSQSILLWDNNGGTQILNTNFATASFTFKPNSSNTYYFGFNDYTPSATIYQNYDYLEIDKITISLANTTYAWSSTPTGFSSDLKKPIATPTQQTSYHLTVTDEVTGCTNSSTVMVDVNNTVPSAPSSLVATITNTGSISVAFTPSATTNPMPTIYQYSTDGGLTWADRTDGGTISSPIVINKLSSNTNTNLTEGISYSIKLRAVNNMGSGGPSITVTATPYVNYTITYDANGGSGAMSNQTFTSTGVSLTSNSYTRSGYTFSGWATSVSGSVAYTNTAYYNATGDITLYAIWLPTSCSEGGIVSGTTSVCTGTNSSTLTLSGNVGDIQWQKSTNNINFTNILNASSSTLLVSNLTSTTYYRAVVTNGVCAPAYSSVGIVTVNEFPVANINVAGSTSICQGASVTLTANSDIGLSYLWSTGATTQNIIVSNTGNYTVTVTNASGCSTTSSPTSITVNALPTISGTPITYAGASTQLTGSVTSASSNAWVSSNTTIATVSTTGLLTGISEGTSTITYTNNNGCQVTQLVTVQASCSIAGTVAGTANVVSGSNSTILSVTGYAGTIQWQSSTDGINFTNLSGETGATYTSYNIINNTYYRVVVSNGACTPSTSNAVQLTTVAPMVMSSLSSSSINESQALLYQVTITGGGTLTKTYSLTNASDGALLNISNTGAVSLKTSVTNYNTKSSYSFTINVSNGVQTLTQNIVVAINNLDEQAPTFTSVTTASVNENQTLLYTAAATDTDYNAPNTASSVSYSLKASTGDVALLTMNASTGVVSKTTGVLDYETKSSYAFTVVATDAAGNAREQALTVILQNLDEQAPTFASATTGTANENQSRLYTATATDTDYNAPNTASSITYSLKAATGDVSLLTMNAITGVVSKTTGVLDYETKSSYAFTVIATDAAGNAREQAVTVTVQNVDEQAPTFSSATTGTANENQSRLYTATATDTDYNAPNTASSITYSLKAATGDVSLLTMNASTGVVSKTTGVLDYETKSSYAFTVVATDAAGNAREQGVTITLNDILEYSVTFNANAGTNTSTTRQSMVAGVSTALAANSFVWVNRRLIGWSSTPTGSVLYQPGASVTLNNDLSLYGVWEVEDCGLIVQGGAITGKDSVYRQIGTTVLTASNYIGAIEKWQSSASADFATAVDINVTSSTLSVTSLTQNTYYRAHVYSDPCRANSTPILVRVVDYATPVVISPLNNAVKQSAVTTLSWNAVRDATEYTLQYGTDASLTTGVTTQVLSATSKTIAGLATNTNYYWKVNAHNGNYTSINKFQTFVQVPVLDEVKAGNKVDTLSWTLGDVTRIKYFKILRNTTSTNSIVIDSVAANKRSYIDNKNLSINTNYYYKVVAGNIDDVESESSNIKMATPFNIRPRAAVLSSQSFNNSVDTALASYTYSGAGSTDVDGTIAEYRWFINDSLASKSSTTNGFTYKYGNGTTKVKLLVVDNDNGVDSSSAEVKVTTVSVTLASGTGVLGGVTAVNPNLIMTADTSSSGSSGSSTIYKMDRYGTVLNTITVQGKITTTPSVGSDSTLFITSGTSISSFDKNGAAKWAPVQLDGAAKVTPTVDSTSGKIFVGTSNNKFYSIDAKTGRVGWSVTSDAPIYTSAMITGDRRLVFVTESGTFYGFDIYADTSSTKNAKWRLALNEVVTKSGAIDHGQNVYYGTAAGNIIKIKMAPDGTTTKVWTTHLSDSILAAPVVDGKGRIYAGTKDGKLYRLDPNTGAIKWTFTGAGAIKSTPSISNYGTVIFATSLGNIYAVDSNMKIRWMHKEGVPISANILYIKNMVYFATENGKYFGLYDDPKAVYNPSMTASSSVNNTIIELNKHKSALVASINTPVISLIRQLDQSTAGFVTEMPMWGTFQGNAQRTGVQIPDCPIYPTINVPLCYEVVDSVKLTTSDMTNKLWVINDVVQSNYKDTAITIKPTDKFDLQTTSIYGCTVLGSMLQYNMSSLVNAPLIASTATSGLCVGDSVSLSIPTSTNKFIWNSVGGAVKDYLGASLKVTKSDKYYVSEVNAFGCKATSAYTTLTFNPIPSVPVLSRDNTGALVSSADYGNVWYKDGVQILDTTKTIKPSLVGNYRVKASLLGCSSSLSSSYYFLVTDVIHLDHNQFIKVAPNPFVGKLNIDFVLRGYPKLHVEIKSMVTGNRVFHQENVFPGTQLQVNHLSAGAYVLRAYSPDQRVEYQFKLIRVN